MPGPAILRAFLIAPLILAACGTTTGRTVPLSQPTSAASTAPAASATAAPSASPSISAAPAATPAPAAAAACDSSASGKGTVEQAQIVAVRVGTHGDYDRIVFEFAGRGGAAGVPPFEIKTAARPLYRDPSGMVMAISGDPVLGITLRGGTRAGLEVGDVYTGPTNFKTDFPTLRELAEGGDFEAIATWYAGLSGSACVSTEVLANPARLVVDIARR
jgi:hypothetical protein